MRGLWRLSVVCVAACTPGGSPAPIPADPLAQFDVYWSAFDTTYPSFAVKGVDWNAQRAQYRGQAAVANSTAALVTTLQAMVAPLNDGHIVFETPAGIVQRTWAPTATINFNRARRDLSLDGVPLTQLSPAVHIASLTGRIAYVEISSWNASQVSAATVDAALQQLAASSSLILDVRANAGGDDRIALAVAGRFLSATRSGGSVRYRNGPAHSDLGAPVLIAVSPRGDRVMVPIMLLTGRGVYSSCESFVEVMRQEALVTTFGDTTGGSSGNPERRDLGDGWHFTVPRWQHAASDGQPIEGRGIAPEVYAEWRTDAVSGGRDVVLDAAVARLRGGGR